MRDSAEILIRDATTEMRFRWLAFDGDDCFDDFHIDVTTESGTQQFSFGPCVVGGLRKLSRFFRNGSEASSVSGVFRNPDIRTYDLFCTAGDYRLVVCLEDSGLAQQLWLRKPTMEFDDEFLAEYDGPDT